MKRVRQTLKGFTLVEIAIVMLIVTILLGYTVALFPRQQELRQYRDLNRKMDEVIAAIVGFAQINGRLPCPAIPNSAGFEDGGGDVDCNNYGGFVPVNTLGLTGRLNADSLLLDPWGNPYRYYVSSSDIVGAGGDVGEADFVRAGEMREVGLVSTLDPDYIDLDGQFLICDAAGTSNRPDAAGGPYAGAPFVLLSQGKNWNEGVAAGDELENIGAELTLTDLAMANGPSGNQYLLKDVSTNETTFVRRITGFADDFDDVVKWVSPNILYSKMIEAGQLP